MLASEQVTWGYKVDDRYPGVYLNGTELQIIVGLLRNKTREKIVHELDISGRTFDYYCCRLLKLMGHYNLPELLETLRDCKFYKYISK